MADISLIKIGTTVYNIKDSYARGAINSLTEQTIKIEIKKGTGNGWVDTGISLKETGTYIVQISVSSQLAASGLDTAIFSGTMTWYYDESNPPTVESSDEIALHAMGKTLLNELYLRTYNEVKKNPKILIAAAKDFTSVVPITFKFKKII